MQNREHRSGEGRKLRGGVPGAADKQLLAPRASPSSNEQMFSNSPESGPPICAPFWNGHKTVMHYFGRFLLMPPLAK